MREQGVRILELAGKPIPGRAKVRGHGFRPVGQYRRGAILGRTEGVDARRLQQVRGDHLPRHDPGGASQYNHEGGQDAEGDCACPATAHKGRSDGRRFQVMRFVDAFRDVPWLFNWRFSDTMVASRGALRGIRWRPVVGLARRCCMDHLALNLLS